MNAKTAKLNTKRCDAATDTKPPQRYETKGSNDREETEINYKKGAKQEQRDIKNPRKGKRPKKEVK